MITQDLFGGPFYFIKSLVGSLIAFQVVITLALKGMVSLMNLLKITVTQACERKLNEAIAGGTK